MGEFLILLASLYLCDARADTRGVQYRTDLTCAAQKLEVHSYFVAEFELAPEGSDERVAQLDAAEAVFVAWEGANADLVADMQAEAWLRARGLVTAMN